MENNRSKKFAKPDKNKTKRRRVYPVKDAFTFAQEMARKYNWPTFVFNGKIYALM